jgi:hypothetical protein
LHPVFKPFAGVEQERQDWQREHKHDQEHECRTHADRLVDDRAGDSRPAGPREDGPQGREPRQESRRDGDSRPDRDCPGREAVPHEKPEQKSRARQATRGGRKPTVLRHGLEGPPEQYAGRSRGGNLQKNSQR